MLRVDYYNFFGQTLSKLKVYDIPEAGHLPHNNIMVNKTVNIIPYDNIVIDKNGNYIYLHRLKDADIIDNITYSSTVKIRDIYYVIVNNKYTYSYEHISEFVIVAMPYSYAYIVFEFIEKPNKDDQIKLEYRSYYLGGDINEKLINCKLITSSNIYKYGQCEPRYKNVKKIKNSNKKNQNDIVINITI
jgi:hypothetical protein